MITVQYKNADLTKYNDFLNSCELKCYEGIRTHNHHIIPKFMKGTNDETNLIKLSYEDHLKAHIILANSFPKNSYENVGNTHATRYISKLITDIELKGEVIALNKGRIPYNKGMKMSAEQRKKISDTKQSKSDEFKKEKSRKSVISRRLNGTDKPTELTRKKMSESQKRYDRTGNRNPMFGRKHTTAALLKCKISSTGTNNGMHGRIHSDESKQKMSDKLRGTREGHKNNKAKKIQCIETGMVFGCMKYASEYYNISGHLIRKKIKQGLLSYIA